MTINNKLKYRKVSVAVFLIFILAVTGLQAQSSLNASGNVALGNSGSVSYSIGQVFFTTTSGTNTSIAEGVQQPYEISNVTGIEQTISKRMNIQVYPNPTTNLLKLSVDSLKTSILIYELLDINGKLINSKKIINNIEYIYLGNLPSAIYFLKVSIANKEVEIFKIIKKS
ncbi:MAG: T9SS type A sorting domain-containing protein [bacterium]